MSACAYNNTAKKYAGSDTSSQSVCSRNTQSLLGTPQEQKEEGAELDADQELDALPMVSRGGSISADIRLGWRPKEAQILVAPIPLYYNFGDAPECGTEGQQKLIYLGPRFSNSLKAH